MRAQEAPAQSRDIGIIWHQEQPTNSKVCGATGSSVVITDTGKDMIYKIQVGRIRWPGVGLEAFPAQLN